MKKRYLFVTSLLCLVVTAFALAADKDEKAKGEKAKTKDKKELKLEDLFPEKSLFGPSASAMAFSYDGRYGAYLYKSYKERRHGNDLFIYDTEKGEARRVTWPSVMAQFQKSARKVVDDRIEKAKKDKPKKDDDKKDKEEEKKDAEKDKDEKNQDEKKSQPAPEDDCKDKKVEVKKQTEKKDDCKKQTEKKITDKKVDTCQKEKETDCQKEQGDKQQQDKKAEGCEKDSDEKKDCDKDKQKTEEDKLRERGDWVGDKDADDEKAPKYSGVGRFKWSPVSNEMLIESEGDIYRYKLCDGKLIRLTHTRDRESYFEWLPDASGYIYRRESSVMKVTFGSNATRQLDPKFPNGDTMERYRISPDGKWIAFSTTKETKAPTTSKVQIASYRDRIMKSKEHSRHVSDDPLPVRERRIYLYQISDDDEKDNYFRFIDSTFFYSTFSCFFNRFPPQICILFHIYFS